MKDHTAIMLQTLHERIEINRRAMAKHILETLPVNTEKLDKLGLNVISGVLKYYKYRMLDVNLTYIKNIKEYPEFYNKLDLLINDCIGSISEILSMEEDVGNKVILKMSYKRSIQEYEVISHTINEVLEEFALNQEVKFPSISIYFKSKREDKGKYSVKQTDDELVERLDQITRKNEGIQTFTDNIEQELAELTLDQIKDIGLGLLSGVIEYYLNKIKDNDLQYLEQLNQYPKLFNSIHARIMGILKTVPKRSTSIARSKGIIKTLDVKILLDYEVQVETIYQIFEELGIVEDWELPRLSEYLPK